MAKINNSREDIEKAIQKTKESDESPVNKFLKNYGAETAGVMAAATGAAAAGTIATAAGVTSIAGISTIASWVGVTAVAATPIGWVLGTAAAFGGGAYALTRWYGSRKANSERARQKIAELKAKLATCETGQSAPKPAKINKNVLEVLKEALNLKAITEEQFKQIKEMLDAGQIEPDDVLSLLDEQYAMIEKSVNAPETSTSGEIPAYEQNDANIYEAINSALKRGIISEEHVRQMADLLQKGELTAEMVMHILKCMEAEAAAKG